MESRGFRERAECGYDRFARLRAPLFINKCANGRSNRCYPLLRTDRSAFLLLISSISSILIIGSAACCSSLFQMNGTQFLSGMEISHG